MVAAQAGVERQSSAQSSAAWLAQQWLLVRCTHNLLLCMRRRLSTMHRHRSLCTTSPPISQLTWLNVRSCMAHRDTTARRATMARLLAITVGMVITVVAAGNSLLAEQASGASTAWLSSTLMPG